ncbi:hypothetical protein ACXWO4_11520, partial [Streptococcus pyogenes]
FGFWENLLNIAFGYPNAMLASLKSIGDKSVLVKKNERKISMTNEKRYREIQRKMRVTPRENDLIKERMALHGFKN